MGVIAALLPNAARLQRLRAAARELHAVVPCDDWGGVFDVLERQEVHMAVLDLEAAGAPSFEPVRRLKQMYPRITLIAYIVFGPDRIRQAFDAGRFGFDALVVADLDDGPAAFGKSLEKAGARGVAALVRQILPESRSRVADDALMISVTRANEALTPVRLAEILGVTPRLLSRHLADVGYPSANRLITWGRLIVAAALMDGTRHSADRIAKMMYFPSGSAFRNTMRRYIALKPSEVRSLGGAKHVIDALRRDIGQYDSNVSRSLTQKATG